MDKLKNLQKQLTEMRRLGQHKSVSFRSKYRDLILQVYKELKKIHKRVPSGIEWAEAGGVDRHTITAIQKTGNYPTGESWSRRAISAKKMVETKHAKPVTGTVTTRADQIMGVKFRNAADKTKVKNILTKWFSLIKNSPEMREYGGQAAVVKKLRTIKDLESKSFGAITAFMNQARKDLNIAKPIQTEASQLARPTLLSERILKSLTEHIRQGGKDFKYAPEGKANLYNQLKIIDVKKPKEILTKASITEAIKNNDPRFREYKIRFDELNKLKKSPFTHPVTGEKMTLLEGLQKSTGVNSPLHLEHIRGVKTSPLSDLSIATWKANMAKIMPLTTKGAKVFGVKTVVPGGTNIVGPEISFAKRQSDLTKFATDLLKKSGTRDILTPTNHLKKLIDSFNASSNPQKVKTAVQLGCLAAAEGGRIGYALGSTTINCVNTKLTNEPVQSSMRLRMAEGVGKIKPAATNFLKLLGRGGAKVAPLAALAAAGAAVEPLVKQFRNDDPTTYLTNEGQMKGMLLATIEGETPKVDEEILKWQMPALGAATAAGAIPGAGEVYRTRRGLPPDIPNKYGKANKFIGPMEKGVGPARAALGIKGVLGKALGASFSPLAVAATLPLSVAAQKSGGTDYGDIATDPFNWMGPAFASTGAEMASKGIKNPMLLKALRMGMSPRTLRLISSRLGMPGLAISAGMWGYDKWKNRSINDED